MTAQQVWIVAQVKSEDGSVWELGGVYSSEEKARAACTEPTDCVWSVTTDEDLGRETVEVGVYPLTDGGGAGRISSAWGRRTPGGAASLADESPEPFQTLIERVVG